MREGLPAITKVITAAGDAPPKGLMAKGRRFGVTFGRRDVLIRQAGQRGVPKAIAPGGPGREDYLSSDT